MATGRATQFVRSGPDLVLAKGIRFLIEFVRLNERVLALSHCGVELPRR